MEIDKVLGDYFSHKEEVPLEVKERIRVALLAEATPGVYQGIWMLGVMHVVTLLAGVLILVTLASPVWMLMAGVVYYGLVSVSGVLILFLLFQNKHKQSKEVSSCYTLN